MSVCSTALNQIIKENCFSMLEASSAVARVPLYRAILGCWRKPHMCAFVQYHSFTLGRGHAAIIF